MSLLSITRGRSLGINSDALIARETLTQTLAALGLETHAQFNRLTQDALQLVESTAAAGMSKAKIVKDIFFPPSDFHEWRFRGGFADGDPLSQPPISVADAEALFALANYRQATKKK